ncbi:alpha/beta fold hydrolase [Roseobacteraceae bacterium S113]
MGKLSLLAIGTVVLAGCGVAVDRRADFREAQAEAKFGPLGTLLQVGDTEVHAYTVGSGPDVVLIHGASGNLRDFTFDLVDRLKDRYRVTAFDRPGLGWTERLPGYRSLNDQRGEPPREQARLLQAAADQLGLAPAIVVGHSFGGAVALAWGLERPDDTAAIVTLGAVSNPWPGDLDRLYRINASNLGGRVVVPLLTAFAPQSRVDSAVASIFAPDPVPPGYVAQVGAPLSLRRDSLRANAQQVWTLRPHIVEMSAHYGDTLKMPVEILHGTADTIVPANVHADVLATQLPDANYTRLENVGHMPHHAAPEAVEDAIDRAAARAGLR